MSRGLFITFEGTEGSGKSTQLRLLRDAPGLEHAIFLREPGGTELGEQIRRLLLHSAGALGATAETHLFLAARAQLVDEVVVPTLEAGRPVVADRYHDSTLAYQEGARGVEVGWPAGFPRPDVTFLLELPVEVGMERLERDGPLDRMEAQGLEFHRKVARAYDRLAVQEPGRFVRLDATLPPAMIQDQIRERLAPLLAKLKVRRIGPSS